MKRIKSFINWLGGPDHKSGKVIWRKGHWKYYGDKHQVWVRGTWIKKPNRKKKEEDNGSDLQQNPWEEGLPGHP